MERHDFTAFELLGIENKELPVSNLLSYYLNPNKNIDSGYVFLNEFCKLANINPVAESEVVFVDREFYIRYNDYNNFIDILIRIGSRDNPSRIICIENKINSYEGIQQTKRYYNALELEFPECKNRQYIYLTKNNSSVNLSSQHFIHIRYNEIGELLADERFIKMPFAIDFYKYYVLREKEQFQNIENIDRDIMRNAEDFQNLINYIVWKINSSKRFQDYRDFFCMHDKSAQSNSHFYQLSMQNWEFEIDEKPMCIHLEGYCNEVYLHMEMKPYEPYNSLEKNHGTEFFDKYVHRRDKFRSSITFENQEDFIVVPIRKNANLQIVKFSINANTYKGYFDTLVRLALCVNDVLIKNSIIDCVI